MRRIASLAVLVALAGLWAPSAHAIDEFFGQFVGSAELIDSASGAVEERDVTTTISPYGEGGFEIEWTSVIRVDGRRDVPGVRQVVRALAFDPGGRPGFFSQAPDYDPFTVRQAQEPMAGDPLAWATVDGNTLDIWVFALTDDGEAEVQVHRRVRDEVGVQLIYEGYHAGELRTQGVGRLVRVD